MEEVKLSIKSILKSISQETLEKVLEALQALGAESLDDLEDVEVGDLLHVLKPTAARKLIKNWTHNESSGTTTEEISQSGSSNWSFESSSSDKVSADWDFNFSIPWNSFPKPLLEACEKKAAWKSIIVYR